MVVRIHKMSGGDIIDCVFKNIKINNFRCDSDNPPEIKITKFCFTRSTIIFFDFLEYNKKKYYKYVIYKKDNKVFVLELNPDDTELEISKSNMKQINKDTLKNILLKIKEKQQKNPKFALRIQEEIQRIR